MKIYLATLFLLLGFNSVLSAQDAESYKAGLEGWEVEIEKAYELSKETGKPIMANFTGSDWCGWCKRLKKIVFVKDEFETWAQDNVIRLELDYPKRTAVPAEIKKQNQILARMFKIRGYPTIWYFNLDKGEDGKFQIEALGKTGVPRPFTVEKFLADSDRILANQKMEKEM